jgi:uncharacterized membrane protein YeaQ/YmgE (transglycosylase-associated protein family)
MSWIIIIITGVIIGFIANMIAKTGSQYGLLTDMFIGVIGSILGRLIFSDWLKIGSASIAGTLSFYGIFWGVVGAIILIAILRALKVY